MYFFRANTWQPLYFLLYYFLFGGIAQLVRAHGSHPWGREFESPCLHHIGASFVSLAPIFYHNQSALTPLLLLFYKKSRAAHLFGYGDFPSRLRPSQRFAVATTFRAFARATPAVKMPKVSFYAISHRLDPEPNALPVLILLTQCMKFFCDAADETFAAPVRAAGRRQLKPMIKPPPITLWKHCMISPNSGHSRAFQIRERQKIFCAANQTADDALVSGSPSNTIKEVTKADIVEIYEKLFS